MSEMSDPRKPGMITYELPHLLWAGALMFILRLKSRRQLKKESETDVFLANLLSLSGTSEESVAVPDTLNYLMERLNVDELESLKVKAVKRLIKERRFDPFRFNGGLRVAIDGTRLYSFNHQHCEHCLKQEHKDKPTTWSHDMLEAKLVCENGLAISLLSEPVQNESEKYDKQDCELKAFYRLAKRLRTTYPRTSLCLLLDGLYACEEGLRICGENHWSYFIVLKKGSIPTLYKRVMEERNAHPENSLEAVSNAGMTQKLSWVTYVKYRSMYFHVVICEEGVEGEEQGKTWVWITDAEPCAGNINELVNKGGRQRWKIENQGFKEQKRDDFELEHLYGETPTAWRNYYQLMQIAHMLDQLMRYGDICVKLQEKSPERGNKPILPFREYYQSTRNFIRRLAESFRRDLFSILASELPGKIQIRFNSS